MSRLLASALLVLACLLAAGPAAAAAPPLPMHNQEAGRILTSALDEAGWWSDAWQKGYTNQKYDEIRLKPLDGGWVPMITGEGSADFEQEIVAETVFRHMSRLPAHMEGAKAVVALGSGHDPVVGSDYEDTFFFIDLTLFYATYAQRMYRRTDPATGRTVLWYEKIEPGFVDPVTWSKYQAKMAAASAGVSLRWAPFNAVIPVSDIYGMFVVEPGTSHTSRVTFVTKVIFGDDASFVARWGSEMPSVLKSGLRNGFVASVAIAAEQQAKKAVTQPGG